MRFEDAVERIGPLRRLRRVASAHVVDHRQLSDDELRAALVKVRPQYLHRETVWDRLQHVLYFDDDNDRRVLSRLILRDVLLEEFGHELPSQTVEEKVIDKEQEIVNQANEIEISHLAAGNKQSKRFQDFELYNFVLSVAWENEESKSADEINLLRKLRNHMRISDVDHRFLEAKLGKFPRTQNQLHTRQDIGEARRNLQANGLLFTIRREDNVDVDVIPDELGEVIRAYFGCELRTESYRALFEHRPLRRKDHLTAVLECTTSITLGIARLTISLSALSGTSLPRGR